MGREPAPVAGSFALQQVNLELVVKFFINLLE
jgi:hypothetical protein